MAPNIVFIMSDQQRRDSLGAYGNRYVSTPNPDALASHATVYEHCYCNARVCTPSRGWIFRALLTCTKRTVRPTSSAARERRRA